MSYIAFLTFQLDEPSIPITHMQVYPGFVAPHFFEDITL